MTNQDYIVVRERFLLDRPDVYQVQGLLPDNCTVTAMLDDDTLVAEVTFHPTVGVLSGVRTDLESNAQFAAVQVFLPEKLDGYRQLSIWYSENGERKRWLKISAADLRKRRGKPQYYIEQEQVDKAGNYLYLRGWAASSSPVSVRLYDKNKHRIKTQVERGVRSDVLDMFRECQIDPNAGFEIVAEDFPSDYVYLVMRDQEGRSVVYRVGIGKLQRTEDKISRYYEKTRRFMETKGMKELVNRTSKEMSVRTIDFMHAHGPAFINNMIDDSIKKRHENLIKYDDWLPKHLRTEEELEEQRKHEFEWNPKISIVVPLYRSNETYLKALVNSVRAQTYSNWELCLSDGSGADTPLRKILADLEKADPRIKVIQNFEQLRISENTNAAIREATGDFIGFADHDDVITEDALYEVVKVLNDHPDTEMIYSDEDKMDGKGTSFLEPQFKPDYDPDLLYTVNYICHFLVVKRELLDKAGLLREEYDGAQDYDFILRCTENTDKIRHITRILYHWRAYEQSTSENPESKEYAFTAGKRAVQAHFDRMNIPAVVTLGGSPGLYHTRYIWPEEPLVSILIPNKDHVDDLSKCINSIVGRSSYMNYEIIVIENNSTEDETFEYYHELEENPRVRIIHYEGKFNYSSINNLGAAEAKGDYLLLLNNDTEVISENWMEELLGYCMRPDVGAVGARLYYEDDTVQHAGVIIGFGSIAGHAFVQQPRKNTGYCHRIICAQDYTAVTAACMMIRRDVFEEVGGFSTDLAVAFNDVDLCLKIRDAGYLIVYNPYCELYHYESKSRGLEDTPEKIERFGTEIATLEKHWPGVFQTPDPYYNPNLTLESQDFSLKRI